MHTAGRKPSDEAMAAVLQELRARGPLTRAALGEATGLSRTTVSGLLMDLRRRGLVDEADRPAEPTGGRPAAPVALLPSAGVAVGVDIGRTHVAVAVVDGGHRVLAHQAERYVVADDPDGTLDVAVRLTGRLLASAGADLGPVLGVGLGIPAPLDADGRVGSLNILPGWAGCRPAEALAARLEVPVQVENDANLGALAEARWGAGRDHDLVVYIKAATGIGGGFVAGGRIYRGATGTAGELGHTTVADSGPVCRCGNRGCLEMVAGGPALLAQLSQSGLEVTDVSDLVAQARAGDPGCRRVLADAGNYLGLAVANLVNLVNPDAIVFGGELGLADELVLGTLRERVARSSLAPAAGVVVVPGVLGDRAEVLGAALFVLREPQRFVGAPGGAAGLDRVAVS